MKNPRFSYSLIILFLSISVIFFIWWMPFFIRGEMPLNEFGYGLIWGDWLGDRLSLINEKVIPEWNPNNVLGVNYIGRDPFNNPLSLGNVFKVLFSDPKKEWVFGVFFYLLILGVGTYKFLTELGISRSVSLLFSVMIIIYPKWMDDIYHGPGKFVTAYCTVPWIFRIVFLMFKSHKIKVIDYLSLGTLGSVIFLGSGAWVSVCLSYLIIPWYLYNLFKSNKEQRSIVYIAKSICCAFFSVILALFLSSYLLFPLIDNLKWSARSLYSMPEGYGLIDFVGLIFPWAGRSFSMGCYDLPNYLIQNNVRFYFGILAVPVMVLLIFNKELRKKYLFFWLWPLLTFFIFSKIGNIVLPVVKFFELLLRAQPSENFLFFNFIFCFSIIMAAGFDHLISQKGNAEENRNGKSVLPIQVKWILKIMMIVYSLALVTWIIFFIMTHFYPEAFNKFLVPLLCGDKGYKLLAFFQILCYSYFYDYFFYIYLLSFILRIFILYIFHSESFIRKKIVFIILGIFMIFDFLLFPRMIYPFTSRIDLAYSEKLEQNQFALKCIKPSERIATYIPNEKILYKNKLFIQALKNKMGDKIKWDPVMVFNIYKASNKDNGYYEPLFDFATTNYPVTVGRQTYTYHESLFPEYFFDFDKALNDKNSRYYRQSWNALWNPYSSLTNIAAMTYIYWYEPLIADNLELVCCFPTGGGYIYKNKKALPKAYIAGNVECFSNRSELLKRLSSDSFNADEIVVTEDPELYDLFVKTNGKTDIKSDNRTNVKIKQYASNRIELEAYVSNTSVIVLTDLFFPYWNAKIDGKISKIYRVNCVFRGMVLEKGEHKIEMFYYNVPFHNGIKVSVITVILLILSAGAFLLCERKARVINE